MVSLKLDIAAGEGLAGTVVRMAYGGMTLNREGKSVPQYMLMQVRAQVKVHEAVHCFLSCRA